MAREETSLNQEDEITATLKALACLGVLKNAAITIKISEIREYTSPMAPSNLAVVLLAVK
jgi:hypothetical protein